jgi:hypothetical protein
MQKNDKTKNPNHLQIFCPWLDFRFYTLKQSHLRAKSEHTRAWSRSSSRRESQRALGQGRNHSDNR